MKINKLVLAMAVLFLTTFAIAACGDDGNGDATLATSTPAASQSLYPLTIEQSDGVDLVLDEAPQRIVSLSPYATEILCEIGAGDQLAAVDLFANCPSGGTDKPELDSFEPSLEAIAGFEPDLVYVDGEGILEALRQIDIQVLYLTLPSSLDEVLERIVEFGLVVDREAEAEALVESLTERIDAVEETVSVIEEGPRIFHELDTTYFTVSPESFIGDFYNILKAQNIAAGGEGEYLQLTAEVIVERDPEVIILADEAAGVTVESLNDRPGWDTLTAVKEGRVCLVDPDIVSRPGPTIADGLEALAQCIYPELFP